MKSSGREVSVTVHHAIFIVSSKATQSLSKYHRIFFIDLKPARIVRVENPKDRPSDERSASLSTEAQREESGGRRTVEGKCHCHSDEACNC